MILHDLCGGEAHPVYQELEIANGDRQYDFINSIVVACIQMRRPLLSHQIIKALNYHAISCLHSYAGEYRPCAVEVGKYIPPPHYQVQSLMDDFINDINRNWHDLDPILLAAYVLWRINAIHPFINGNGRTARASAYFALCVCLGGPLKGKVTLPQLLKINRDEYVLRLRHADATAAESGSPDLVPLHEMLGALLQIQIDSIEGPAPENGGLIYPHAVISDPAADDGQVGDPSDSTLPQAT